MARTILTLPAASEHAGTMRNESHTHSLFTSLSRVPCRIGSRVVMQRSRTQVVRREQEYRAQKHSNLVVLLFPLRQAVWPWHQHGKMRWMTVSTRAKIAVNAPLSTVREETRRCSKLRGVHNNRARLGWEVRLWYTQRRRASTTWRHGGGCGGRRAR